MDQLDSSTRKKGYGWSNNLHRFEKIEWHLFTWSSDRGKEIYSFTYGFFGYHHIRIIKEDRHKTTFAMEWGCFQYTVIPFGLKNAPANFSRILVAPFKDSIHKFIEVYFNDWKIFGLIKDHIESLTMMLEHCC